MFAEVNANIRDLKLNQETFEKTIASRINDLEKTVAAEDSKVSDHDQSRDMSTSDKLRPQSPSAGVSLGFSSIQSEDLQLQFNAIKDSLQRQKLAPDLHLTTAKTGISNQCRDSATILATTSKYVGTSFKLVDGLLVKLETADQSVQQDLKALLTVQLAELRYIQEEYAALVVQGTFGSKTHKLFRSLQKHTSAFTPSVIEQVKTAAELATFVEPGLEQIHQRGGFRGGFRGYNNQTSFRGRGGFRGRFRGGFHQSQQQYPGFQPREVPSERAEPDNN